MSSIEQFRKDAIAGGWGADTSPCFDKARADHCDLLWQSSMLLSPLAWQAVGKTRGWNDETAFTTLNHDDVPYGEGAEIIYWHRFIDALAYGLSIEDALGKISN